MLYVLPQKVKTTPFVTINKMVKVKISIDTSYSFKYCTDQSPGHYIRQIVLRKTSDWPVV